MKKSILLPIVILFVLICALTANILIMESLNNKSEFVNSIIQKVDDKNKEVVTDSMILKNTYSGMEIISTFKEKYTNPSSMNLIDSDLDSLSMYADSIEFKISNSHTAIDGLLNRCDTIVHYGIYESVVKFNRFVYKKSNV
jgi:hypothetical protein